MSLVERLSNLWMLKCTEWTTKCVLNIVGFFLVFVLIQIASFPKLYFITLPEPLAQECRSGRQLLHHKREEGLGNLAQH